MTAEVRFNAFNRRTTPKVEGTLISVSADRLVDPSRGVPYFLAQVEIAPEGMRVLERSELDLLPGMPAEVLINTGERTLVEYLLAPIQDTLATAFIEE
jgi:epimerase transport system membrane fusion protein